MELIWPAIAVIGFIVLILALFFAFQKKKLEDKLYKKTGKHPVGYYKDTWLATGIAIGVAIGISLDIIPVGMVIGLAIGYAIGISEENKHKDELRPLTKEEEEMKRKTVYVLLILLVLGAITGAAAFFLFQ